MSSSPKINSSILVSAVGMLSPFYPNLTPQALSELLESTKEANSQPTPILPKPLTRFEVAELLGLSTQTINRMLNRGVLRRIQVGMRAVRIDPASVRAILEGNANTEE